MNALNETIAQKNRVINRLNGRIKDLEQEIASLKAQLGEAEKELEMNDYAEPVPLTDEPNDDMLEAPNKEPKSEANRSVRAGYADGGVRKHRPGHTGLND